VAAGAEPAGTSAAGELPVARNRSSAAARVGKVRMPRDGGFIFPRSGADGSGER